jgi:hypothetical protein
MMRIWVIVAALAICSCSPAQATDDRPKDEPPVALPAEPAASPVQPSPRPGKQAVEVEMRHVNLHVTGDIALGVRHLRGRFEPAGRAEIPYLDDKHSYLVVIDSAEIALDMPSLNAMMAQTLGNDQSNVEKVKISIDEEHRLQQKGVLDKGIRLPFNVKGGIEATPDGRLRLHAAKVKSLGVPVNPLMKVFSIEMDDLLKVKPGHGVTVDRNDLILDPQLLLPPPLIRGKVTAARVDDDALVLTFGSGDRLRLSPPATSQHYIYWRGAELQFGKLLMTNTDLELVDDDADDPFDFSVDHWNDQLVAGYSKTRPNRGLKAHMPDYNDLKAAVPAPTSPRPR